MTMALRKRTAAGAVPRRRHKNPRSGTFSAAPAGHITVTVLPGMSPTYLLSFILHRGALLAYLLAIISRNIAQNQF